MDFKSLSKYLVNGGDYYEMEINVKFAYNDGKISKIERDNIYEFIHNWNNSPLNGANNHRVPSINKVYVLLHARVIERTYQRFLYNIDEILLKIDRLERLTVAGLEIDYAVEVDKVIIEKQGNRINVS